MPDLVPQNQSSPSATTAQLNFSSTEAYIKAEKRKKVRKDWKLPQSCSGDNESDHELHQWRPPDPIEVLRYMLQKVRILNSDRYGEYLQQIEEESFIQEMIDLLRPQAWEIFKSREYTREK
jgi:hypothetical protein